MNVIYSGLNHLKRWINNMGYELLLVCVVISFFAGYITGQNILKRSHRVITLPPKPPRYVYETKGYKIRDEDGTFYDTDTGKTLNQDEIKKLFSIHK